MRQKSYAGVTLPLIGFKTDGEAPKHGLRLNRVESFFGLMRTGKISPEQPAAADNQREQNNRSPCSRKNRPNPTAVDHQTTLRVPLHGEIEERNGARARPKLPGRRATRRYLIG
jgi:hypothetical protein